MLRGAVSFGEDFEETYMKQIFCLEKGMTQAISHFSRFEDAQVLPKQDGKYEYKGIRRRDALNKIRLFYWTSIGILVAAAALVFYATAHFGQIK
jgi:hypothetical protein